MAYLYENRVQTRPIWYLRHLHLQNPYLNCQRNKIEKAYDMLEKTLNILFSVNFKIIK